MANRKDVLEKIENMLKNDRDWLIEECNRLLDTGALDIESYPDNFELPKIVYYTALGNLVGQFGLIDSWMKDIKNLKCF